MQLSVQSQNLKALSSSGLVVRDLETWIGLVDAACVRSSPPPLPRLLYRSILFSLYCHLIVRPIVPYTARFSVARSSDEASPTCCKKKFPFLLSGEEERETSMKAEERTNDGGRDDWTEMRKIREYLRPAVCFHGLTLRRVW